MTNTNNKKSIQTQRQSRQTRCYLDKVSEVLGVGEPVHADEGSLREELGVVGAAHHYRHDVHALHAIDGYG